VTRILIATLALLSAGLLAAQDFDEQRRRWNQPQPPVRIAGDTWYVGTRGLSAILIRGDQGAVLIDGALPESAPLILANLAELGVTPGDVRLLLNSHAHMDHAGGLAELQRATGARLLLSPESAALAARGGLDDLHFGDALPFQPVRADGRLKDGQVLRLGRIALTAHFTPGHTPGSTSWSWEETEGGQRLNLVYADSLTAPGYRLVGHPRYPNIVRDFRASAARIAALSCRILLSPHPEFFGMADKLAAAGAGETLAFGAEPRCGDYADRAGRRLDAQLAHPPG
jgi:metallo-beta-lactamase class B